jgi:hypothetical protein
VIYRKLGIEGRRDINMKIPDGSPSSDDDKGA